MEELESRLVPALLPTVQEQLFLELLNDARANPAAYGASIGLDLNNVAASQPLAFNTSLIEAARLHSQDMAAQNYFSHFSPNGNDPGDRISASGFAWNGYGESIAAGYPTPAAALSGLIIDEGIPDLGHRRHLLAIDDYFKTHSQIGIGVVQNTSGAYRHYYTLDTGHTSDTRPFLTGVVFNDLNDNGRYDVNEGLGNVNVQVAGVASTTTFGTGGYSLQMGAGTFNVTFSGAGLSAPVTRTVTLGSSNVRLNIDSGAADAPTSTNLPFNDTFTQANGSSLGTTWTGVTGNFRINGNAAANNAVYSIATVNMAAVADVSVRARVSLAANTGGQVGLVTRYGGNGDSNYYTAFLANSGSAFSAHIYRNVGGVFTLLSSQSVGGGSGVLRFDAIGTSLKLYLDDVLVGFANDGTLAQGRAGIRAFNGGTYDDFNVANHGSTASVPFNDAFTATAGDRQQLQDRYTEVVGNFRVTGGQVTNNAVYSVATVNMAAVANVSVQARVTLANGGQVGLVARYGGSGDSNYYTAFLANSGSTFSAHIYRNVGGVFTLLSSQNVGSGSGTLRFDAIGTSLKLYLDDVLVGFANDGMLTQGRAGIRAFNGGTYDDFNVANHGNTAAVPFNDAFTATAGDRQQLQDRYTEVVGNFRVSGGQVTNNAVYSVATLNMAAVADVSVRARVSLAANTGGQVGLVTRYSGNGDSNYYTAFLANSGSAFSAHIYRNVGGVFTLLSSQNVGSGSGTLRFDAIGTSLKLYLDDVLVGFANDGMLTQGRAGIRAFNGGTYDDFNVANHGNTAAVPFNDAFTATAGDRQQLQDRYTEVVGNFRVTGGQVTNNAVYSVATLNMASVANVSVQARVSLAANSGGQVGLVARYGGSGDSNYYTGIIVNNGTSFTAQIYRNVGGTFTLLSSQSLGSNAVGLSGTLRLDAIGTSLRLFVDNNLVTSANDGMLTQGKVGLRAFRGGSYDDLTVTAL